jgi:hypothetical protein
MPNTIDMIEVMAMFSYSLDSIAAWFFCSVISIFVFPAILDRITFYVPRMIRLYKLGEVFFNGIVWTILEIIFWTGVIVTSYVCYYVFARNLFLLTTISSAAIVAWGIGIFHIVYRTKNFDRIIKKNFYYTAYMRYIKPEALKEYQKFIDDLDSLALEEIAELLNKNLPYMHKQAVLRKQIELSRI